MDDLLTPLPDSGIPESNDRLPSADAAVKIYNRFRTDDELSAANRAVVQAMIDGAAPYDQEALIASGGGHRYNVSRGDGAAYLADALTAYTDLITGVDKLICTYLPVGYGDAVTRSNDAAVIDEEFTAMVHEWDDFDSHYQRLICELNAHGCGFATFMDSFDWKFYPGGWDDYLVPRQAPARESGVDILIGRRSLLIHELFAHIKDPKAAKEIGWNVDEVRRELVAASRGKRDNRGWHLDWARMEKELKNGDMGFYAESQSVPVLHFWVRGFDGRYSHYITAETPGKTCDFLFKSLDRYDKATNAFVIFTNAVAQNGTLHGIRGLGYRLFPQVQIINRMWCQTLDAAQISNSVFLQPRENAALDSPAITFNGAVGYLNPDFAFTEIKFANPADSSLRIIEEAQRVTQQNTGQYRGGAAQGSDMTKYQVQAQQELQSTLSVSAVNLFYRCWRRLLQEMFRRVQAIRPGDKAFPEVTEFYKRCAERGVPPETVKAITRTEAVKAVGYGSSAQRQLAFDEAMQLMGSFDEHGRNAIIRDRLSSRLGRDTVDRYLPKVEQPRPVIDEKVAILENMSLMEGHEIPVMSGENHAVHAGIHTNAMLEEAQSWEQARMEMNLDFEKILPKLEFVRVALIHNQAHVDALSQDKTRQTEYGQFRQSQQQLEQMLRGFTAMYQRYLRDNNHQSPDEVPDQDPTQSADFQLKLQEQEARLAMARAEQDATLSLKAEEVRANIELKRAQADAAAAAKFK